MALSNTFRSAVNSGDVTSVRIMMKDSLLLDLTFNEFAEMESMVRTMNGLYDEHDGREFIMDKSKWDDDYMNKLMVQVEYNFSHERIEHLKNVVRYLHPADDNTVNRRRSVDTVRSDSAERGTRRVSSGNRSNSYDERSSSRSAAPYTKYERSGGHEKVYRNSSENSSDYREKIKREESEMSKNCVIGGTAGAIIGGGVGLAVTSATVGGLIIGAAVGGIGGATIGWLIAKGGN